MAISHRKHNNFFYTGKLDGLTGMSVGDGRDRGGGSSRAKRACVVIPIFVCSLQARFTPGVWAPQSSLELVLRRMPGLRYKSLASSLRPGSFQLR